MSGRSSPLSLDLPPLANLTQTEYHRLKAGFDPEHRLLSEPTFRHCGEVLLPETRAGSLRAYRARLEKAMTCAFGSDWRNEAERAYQVTQRFCTSFAEGALQISRAREPGILFRRRSRDVFTRDYRFSMTNYLAGHHSARTPAAHSVVLPMEAIEDRFFSKPIGREWYQAHGYQPSTVSLGVLARWRPAGGQLYVLAAAVQEEPQPLGVVFVLAGEAAPRLKRCWSIYRTPMKEGLASALMTPSGSVGLTAAGRVIPPQLALPVGVSRRGCSFTAFLKRVRALVREGPEGVVAAIDAQILQIRPDGC